VAATKSSYDARQEIEVDGKTYVYYSLPKAAEKLGDITRLPYTLKVLL